MPNSLNAEYNSASGPRQNSKYSLCSAVKVCTAWARRMVLGGALCAWEFAKDGEGQRVRVSVQRTFNSFNDCLQAVLDGFGNAFLLQAAVAPYPRSGALTLVLDDWSQFVEGLHLYSPSRRHTQPAFRILVDTQRLMRDHHSPQIWSWCVGFASDLAQRCEA